MIIERKPEQLRGGRVRIHEPARGVDRDDSAAYVLEDVGGLETDLHQFRRQLLGARTRLAQPSRDVPAPKRNRREHPELQPDPEVQRRAGRDDDVGEVQDAAERRDQQAAGVRQEQRRGSDDEDVEGGELRGSAARDVDDRRYDDDVEQRLRVQERGPERLLVESRCTARSRR